MALWNACRRTLRRLGKRLGGIFSETIRDNVQVVLLDSGYIAPARPGDVRVVRLGVEDLAHVRSQFGDDQAALFASRLEHSIAYVAVCSGEIAGWAWATDMRQEHEGRAPFQYTVRPTHQHFYIYDVHVEPVYRHLRAAGRLVWSLLDQARLQECRSVFLIAREGDPVMERLYKHQRFVNWGQLTYRRRLWWSRTDTTALEQWHTLIRMLGGRRAASRVQTQPAPAVTATTTSEDK
jgi:ribosomal protein S18 acetylase RimI-like enzyme